ncbi:hypothetical protein [Nocardioides sp. WS12]|uniref:hypothetical protein n=1 Tax=Nocardioides sp. WS12 TaxID=2486272 RepID=UPI0015FB58AA|nr:hypothetical protein [Nocardioides sp. WS12]
MTPEGKQRQPSRFDRWVMEHSTAALLVGIALAVAGVVLGAMARSGSDLAGVLQWVAFAPAALIIGMSAQARSMARRARR